MRSVYRESLERYLSTLHIKTDRVLDVAGAQDPVRKRLASCDCQEYAVTDLLNPHEKNAKVDYFTDMNDPISSTFKDYWDVIFCLELMEYLWNPLQCLVNLNHWIKKGGTLYISFPFIYPHHNPPGVDYFRYTEWGARFLLEKAGFKIKEVIYRNAENGSPEAIWHEDRFKGSNAYEHHDAYGFIFVCEK